MYDNFVVKEANDSELKEKKEQLREIIPQNYLEKIDKEYNENEDSVNKTEKLRNFVKVLKHGNSTKQVEPQWHVQSSIRKDEGEQIKLLEQYIEITIEQERRSISN